MAAKSTSKVSVVIPNWNGLEELPACLDSLLAQQLAPRIIVVENGSKDGSLAMLKAKYPTVTVIIHAKNKGFAGGVNAGIRRAIKDGDDYVALFNSDAVADSAWLMHLVAELDTNDKAGIATCKLLDASGKHIDSTGENYNRWGLADPRGRGEPVSDAYDDKRDIFAASGGASIYRVSMLQEIGLFDEDFFAYYEDVDISFRAQLAGWKVRYVPAAVAYHQIGATSSGIKGFTTKQTIKNLPWLLWRNTPFSIYIRVLPKFLIFYYGFIITATWRGQSWQAFSGYCAMLWLLPKKTVQRWRIQHHRKVSAAYIWDRMTPDLAPDVRRRLGRLRHPLNSSTR